MANYSNGFEESFGDIAVEFMRREGLSDTEIQERLGRAASLAAYLDEKAASGEDIILHRPDDAV